MDEQLKLLKKINRRTRFTQFLAWLALFFTAVGIAAGYKNWLRIHDKAKLALREIAEIKKEIPSFALEEKLTALEKEINDNFNVNKTHLDKAMTELRTIQDSTQYIADSVYVQVEELTKQQPSVQIQTPTIKDWSLGEVHFLLQTAVQQFKIKKDKESSIISFKLADNLLLERGELKLLPVRKKISEDIATVNQYTAIDVSAVSQKIDALLKNLQPETKQEKPTEAKNIDLLPTNTTKESEKKETSAESETLVNRVKKTINDAVIIRKLDKPLQEDLDIDSKERLYQLFSLRFETLKIMLLQADNDNYQQQIERIESLIVNYYSKEKSEPFLGQLKELERIDLSPKLPNINGSLELLETLMAEKNTILDTNDEASNNKLQNDKEVN